MTVAAGTTVGTHTLNYRICEIAMPSNCDDAIVTVTVLATPIIAGSDYARGSSKVASTAIANVLANDRLGSAPATLANVTLSFVSLDAGEQQDPARSHGRVGRRARKDGVGALPARVRDLRDRDADQLRARDGAARLDREPLNRCGPHEVKLRAV